MSLYTLADQVNRALKVSTRRGWFKLLTDGLKRLDTRSKKFNKIQSRAKADTSLAALDPTVRRRDQATQHERMQAEAVVNGVDMLRVAVSPLLSDGAPPSNRKLTCVFIVGFRRATNH